MALNAETEDTTLNVKLMSDDGSERRYWGYDSERQMENTMMALNAETKKVTMMALNADTEKW